MIVLDCSAAVAIVRQTEEGQALNSFITAGDKIISSTLLQIELASAFGKYVKAGLLDKVTAVEYIQNACAFVDEFMPIKESCIEALHESLRLGHSVYDLLYFVLARRSSATLFTLDKELMKLCAEQGIDCIHEVNI